MRASTSFDGSNQTEASLLVALDGCANNNLEGGELWRKARAHICRLAKGSAALVIIGPLIIYRWKARYIEGPIISCQNCEYKEIDDKLYRK